MPLHKVNDGSDFELNYEIIPGILPENTLFLHGNLASNRWWYPAEKIWTRKAKNRDYKGSMILAEFRGCGKSSAPRGQHEISISTFAQDFISLVNSLCLGPMNLVGHSTGGLIAALMLAKAPHLFKKAVLLDPVGATGVTFQETMTAAFEQMKMNKELVATVMAATIHNNDATSDFFRQIVVEDAFHAVQTVGVGVLKALDGLDVREECSKIAHPVLVLHGEHDQLLSRTESRALASLMSNGKFQVIEGHGHCANAESPERFTDLVGSFAFCQ